WAVVMPAAIDSSSGCRDCASPASDSQTERITCGLTASTQVSARSAAASAVSWVPTPKSACSAWRNAGTGSATCRRPGGWPRPTSPPIRARAMLPPPMKAIVLSSMFGNSFWFGSAAAWAEQGGADAHQGGTFGDGQGEILAHAHGQGIHPGVAGGEGFVALAQGTEAGPAPFGVGV